MDPLEEVTDPIYVQEDPGPVGPDGPEAPDGPDGPEAPDGPDGPDGPEGPEAPAGIRTTFQTVPFQIQEVFPGVNT